MQIISQNARRNMQMVVLQNTNEDGKKQSITAHIPIDAKRLVSHPNHGYMKDKEGNSLYFQPKGVVTSSSAQAEDSLAVVNSK